MLDRSQSLFYFVPQEKGLIWRPLCGWKNMRESILLWKNGPTGFKKRPKVGGHMPRSHGNLSDFVFVHYLGRSSHFSEGHRSVYSKKYLNPQVFLPICVSIFPRSSFSTSLHHHSHISQHYQTGKRCFFCAKTPFNSNSSQLSAVCSPFPPSCAKLWANLQCFGAKTL